MQQSIKKTLYTFAYGRDIKIYTILECTGFSIISVTAFAAVYYLFDINTALLSLPVTLCPALFALYLALSFKRRALGLHIDLNKDVFIVHDVFCNRYYKKEQIADYYLEKRRYLDDYLTGSVSCDFIFVSADGSKLFSFDCPYASYKRLQSLLDKIL